MAHSTSDKIQPSVNPPFGATCCVCHKNPDGQTRFLDFQMDIDYYGPVVVCEDCWKNGMDALGFVPDSVVAEIATELEIAEQKLLEVREENEKLRSAVSAICLVRPDLVLDSVGDDGVDDPLPIETADGGESSDKGFDGSLASGGSEILFSSPDPD